MLNLQSIDQRKGFGFIKWFTIKKEQIRTQLSRALRPLLLRTSFDSFSEYWNTAIQITTVGYSQFWIIQSQKQISSPFKQTNKLIRYWEKKKTCWGLQNRVAALPFFAIWFPKRNSTKIYSIDGCLFPIQKTKRIRCHRPWFEYGFSPSGFTSNCEHGVPGLHRSLCQFFATFLSWQNK